MKKETKVIILILLLLINFPITSADDELPLCPIWGSVKASVWNESNMSQAILFDIFITNEEGTETYEQKNCSYTILMNTSDLPQGDRTVFILQSTGYKMRTYYYDIELGFNYTFDFYLPPYEEKLQGSPPNQAVKTTSDIANVVNHLNNLIIPMTYVAIDIVSVYVYDTHSNNVERTKMNVEDVTNPANNLFIPMDFTATDIIGVYVYNISSGYGTWESIADSAFIYDENGPNITIAANQLNVNTTKGRVDYYYIYEEPGTSYPSWDLVSDEDWEYYVDGPNTTIFASGLNENVTQGRVDYTYKYTEGAVTEIPLYVVSVIGPAGEYSNGGPLEGVELEFKRYNEYNDTWVNVSVLYTDANGQVSIYLIPHVLYKVKISKDDYDTEFADFIPSSLVLTHTFRLSPIVELDDFYYFNDVIRLFVNWTSNESGLFGLYTDWYDRTVWVNFTVWNYTDGIRLYYYNSTLEDFNASGFTQANHSMVYKWKFSIRHYFWNETIVMSGYLYPLPSCIDLADLEYYLNLIFGLNPMVSDDGTRMEWMYLVVGAIGFIILLSFGSYHAEIGFAGMGVWLSTAWYLIPDLNFGLFIGGLLIIGLAFLSALRGK